MGLYRAAILANDYNVIDGNGYVDLITSLEDEDRAKVVMEIRREYVRIKLLQSIETDTRKEILDKITQIQIEGYATLDGDSWFGVATPEFNSVCCVCNNRYKNGEVMINKTCGSHTCHIGCARKKWGEKRVDWLARPCGLCKNSVGENEVIR